MGSNNYLSDKRNEQQEAKDSIKSLETIWKELGKMGAQR